MSTATESQECELAARDAIDAIRNAARAAVVEIERATTVAEEHIATLYGHVIDADEEIERLTHRKATA